MGRPNNKKKGKGRVVGGTKKAASPPAEGGAATFATGAAPEKKQTTQWRPAPDMSVLHKPENITEALFAVDPDDRSATARRLAGAFEALNGLEARVAAGGNPQGGGGNDVPISCLTNDPDHVRNCIDLIRALSASDFRVPVNGFVVQRLPLPSCWSHVTQLRAPAGSSDEPQLMNVRAKDVVVLLGAAVALMLPGHVRQACQIVHELRIHAENGVLDDWTDREDLGGDASPPMTEAEVRFFLAQLGIKCTRKLYREGDHSSPRLEAMLGKVRNKDLFESIEAFAKDQIRYRPECAQGYYNLAWVETQRPRMVKGSDPLAAAADCLHLLRRSYEAADAEDDDFHKAKARIDAAYCLVHGAGGIVGIKGGHIVERDMRSKAAKVAEGNGSITVESFVVRAATVKDQARIVENERRRLAASVPETKLDPGEKILIAHWDVRKLWNEAMVSYDDLCRWGWSHIVYGESQGWEAVSGYLKIAKKNAYNQYTSGPVEPGFPAIRDKGQGHFNCGWCGKYGGKELSKCGQCKKAYYCGPVCAKKDWIQGGHKARCQKA